MKYVELYESGVLRQRIREAYRRLACCNLCPHVCGVNRIKDERGICGAGIKPRIASANVHHGEEPPISGTKGSGTVFLSGCSLKCIFCQNFPISQLGNGEELSIGGLAQRMLKLQQQGVHNINFVTPTHYLPQILAALWQAIPRGFRLPIVWNSSGYETVDALELLDGIVDIYLPDMKYSDERVAIELSSAPAYRDVNRAAISEMLRQVGHLELDETGIAVRGMIIRHLVLPSGRSGLTETLQWIADNLGTATHIALMNQYFPAHKAVSSDVIGRKTFNEEYSAAVDMLEKLGFEYGWVQE